LKNELHIFIFIFIYEDFSLGGEESKKERSTCDRCTSGKWVVTLQGGVEISQ